MKIHAEAVLQLGDAGGMDREKLRVHSPQRCSAPSQGSCRNRLGYRYTNGRHLYCGGVATPCGVEGLGGEPEQLCKRGGMEQQNCSSFILPSVTAVLLLTRPRSRPDHWPQRASPPFAAVWGSEQVPCFVHMWNQLSRNPLSGT